MIDLTTITILGAVGFLILISLIILILQNQNNMALTIAELTEKLNGVNSKLDSMSGAVDNIQQDNAEQTALIKELKEKLENQPDVPQEVSDLVDQIDAKAAAIGERIKTAADEWPAAEPEENGGE